MKKKSKEKGENEEKIVENRMEKKIVEKRIMKKIVENGNLAKHFKIQS